MLLLLSTMMFAAWLYGSWADARQPVPVKGQKLAVVDGDSFTIGDQKLRLDGIDAPEYRQTCNDAAGQNWQCGKAARAALEQMLLEPGLACVAEAKDRYARSIATCSTSHLTDVAAAQVSAGMALSNEFYGMRSYGREEDEARAAKRGLWRGTFTKPSDWRATHPALRTNTLPAE